MTLENALIKLGKNNSPTFVAMSIAIAKAIFRPAFTMMDKEQDKSSKTYTALREGLTEVIAIGVYWGSGKLANILAGARTRKLEHLPKTQISKDVFQNILKETNLPQGMTNKRAHEISKTFYKNNSTLSMLGVFASALFVIPAVCSLTIKPVMKATKLNQPQKPQQQAFPVKSYYRPSFNSFMKVGGV